VQLALSVLVWGVAARTVYVWHVSAFVNSVSHLWGYRNYETNDGSRNNLFVGYFAHGEGWHNNHHADQRSARHGHQWWEAIPGMATRHPILHPFFFAIARFVGFSFPAFSFLRPWLSLSFQHLPKR